MKSLGIGGDTTTVSMRTQSACRLGFRAARWGLSDRNKATLPSLRRALGEMASHGHFGTPYDGMVPGEGLWTALSVHTALPAMPMDSRQIGPDAVPVTCRPCR